MAMNSFIQGAYFAKYLPSTLFMLSSVLLYKSTRSHTSQETDILC